MSKWEQFLKVRTYISPWISFRPKQLSNEPSYFIRWAFQLENFKVVTNRLKVKRDKLLKSLKWPITWPGSMWSLKSMNQWILAFAQITTGYGFSPWRGQIFEIFETKGPWNDLLNDLMNSTSPNRLVFLITDQFRQMEYQMNEINFLISLKKSCDGVRAPPTPQKSEN